MEKLVQTLKDYYQDNLVSVYQYGFPVKNATIHLLIILKDVTAEAVKPKKFAPPKLTGPVQYTLFSQDEITEALDVFPMEFLAMETTKTLLAGTDILHTPINNDNLRHECEFTLRSTILKLRAAYLCEEIPTKELIVQSASSVLIVLAGILRIKSLPPASDSTELIMTIEDTLKISLSELKIPEAADFNRYMSQITELTHYINSAHTTA
jgi:hypothetical protein